MRFITIDGQTWKADEGTIEILQLWTPETPEKYQHHNRYVYPPRRQLGNGAATLLVTETDMDQVFERYIKASMAFSMEVCDGNPDDPEKANVLRRFGSCHIQVNDPIYRRFVEDFKLESSDEEITGHLPIFFYNYEDFENG